MGADDTLLGENPSWLPLVRQILGNDSVCLWQGVVLSKPGCASQREHADGPPLFRGKTFVQLPPHCLTVFVPLVDLSSSSSTVFYPGIKHVAASQAVYESDQVARVSTSLPLQKGSAILFDY
eukprot:SAG22_NODE_13342_length_410_cov_0.594855_1_plen_121_part_01